MSKAAVADQDFLLAGLRAREMMGEVLVRAARDNPAVFAQFVYRDESGDRIELARMHKAWHKLLTENDRLVLWSHLEAGKSVNVSLLRVLWEVGRNPNLRVLILSNTHKQAEKMIRVLAQYITSSPELHAVFPDLLPTKRKSEAWQAGQLTVRRPFLMKEATITCSGLHGNILGARYDLIIMDDVLDEENTRGVSQRKDTIDWITNTVFGRLTKGGRIWIIGTAFHPDDALHHFAAMFSRTTNQQRSFAYPVMEADGTPRWPEVWPKARIERYRQEVGSIKFARNMLCVARDDSEARFKREWVDRCVKRGADRSPRQNLEHVPPGCTVYTGVDLAVKQQASADLTVFFTILVHPNEDREVLCIESGRWHGQEIVQRVIDTHRRFTSIVIVEDNAAQEFILQFTRAASAAPVRPFTTTSKNKHHPEYGVESIAAEMESGKWIIPSLGGLTPEVNAWVDDMLYYDPNSHTGDRLMACWFAREASRTAHKPKARTMSVDLMSR